MLHRRRTGGLAILITLTMLPALADELTDCRSAISDQALAACTAIIQQPGRSSKELADAHGRRALILQRKGDLGRALSDANRSLEIEPRNPSSFLLRARIRTQQKQWRDALSDFGKAIQLKPDLGPAYEGRGTPSSRAATSNRLSPTTTAPSR